MEYKNCLDLEAVVLSSYYELERLISGEVSISVASDALKFPDQMDLEVFPDKFRVKLT